MKKKLKKKQIALIASSAPSLINFRLPLIKYLVEQGYEVHLVAPAVLVIQDKVLQQVPVSGCYNWDLDRRGLNPLLDIKSCFQLYKILKLINPDRVLAYTIKPIVFAGPVAKLAGVKSFCALVTGRGVGFSEHVNVFVGLVVRILYRFSIFFAECVIFQNRDDRLFFKNSGLLTANTATGVVNGTGVDLAYYRFASIPKNLTFLFMSRLLYSKGLGTFLDCAAEFKRRYPEARFIVAGGFENGNDSFDPNMIEQLNQEGIIDYRGHVEDVRSLLKEASVFVLPSVYPEGIPRSAMEAMAVGRPIVTTNTPGCRELVEKNENGFLMSDPSAAALMRILIKIAELPTFEIELMGKKSRFLAERKFDVHRVNRNMVTLLDMC